MALTPLLNGFLIAIQHTLFHPFEFLDLQWRVCLANINTVLCQLSGRTIKASNNDITVFTDI